MVTQWIGAMAVIGALGLTTFATVFAKNRYQSNFDDSQREQYKWWAND
jgi:hypothetical protein